MHAIKFTHLCTQNVEKDNKLCPFFRGSTTTNDQFLIIRVVKAIVIFLHDTMETEFLPHVISPW
jgi:hypothetical protein